MSSIKFGLLVFSALLLSTTMKAQTLEEGKKFMYYERYQSAKNVFQKLAEVAPVNPEAVYWLGISVMAAADYSTKSLADAKDIYRKALEANSNSALLIAAMGNVELREGKTQDARNRFETALSLSQNKDLLVLTAVGMANSDFDNKYADPAYGIEKLKIATNLKKFKEPSVFIYMGDAYKKMLDGGNAQISYQSALNIDPKYARAIYRIGKIYQTQGAGQEEIYLKYFNEAIEKDPAYAPVYKNLSDLYYNIEVTKSSAYLDKYLANTDDDPKNCYYRASMKYAQGLFKEAITLADQCIAGSTSPYPKLYGIQGYAFNRLGDSVGARKSFENYIAKADQSQIGSGDYATYANVLFKLPGNDSLAGVYIDKAVQLDTLESSKVAYLKTTSLYFENQKNYKAAADWYAKILTVKKAPTSFDLNTAGLKYFKYGNYTSAIEIFSQSSKKYPEDVYAYYMTGKSYWAIDTTMEQGLANPAFQKVIEVGMADKVKNKAQLIASYKYFVAYYANIKKDKAAAMAYCDSVLVVDPADVEAASNKAIIEKLNMNPTPTPATPASKTTSPAANKPAGDKPSGAKKASPATKQ
jgi:Flp pilus assembly protein TadD